jgi:glycosyltransferase involved in cell wall biosynthesis
MSTQPVVSEPMNGLRILALMEATSLTGPAKNLIAFGRWLNSAEGRSAGLSLSVATFDRNPRSVEPNGLVAAVERAGLQMHVIPERRRFDPAVVPRLVDLIESADPHIIQTHNNKSHLLLRMLSRSRHSRLWFAFHHGEAYTNLRQRVYNHVDRFSLRDADRVITVCDAFGRKLVGAGVRTERLRILHNSIEALPPLSDAERLALRTSVGSTHTEALILSVGRLSSEKGHADLLTALGYLPTMRRPWRAVFVGAGPEQRALLRLARKHGIEDRVHFAGFRNDAARLCQAADIFALPSHSEGSSNALLEAMAANSAIVATAAGGNSEILQSGRTGLLVPIKRPKEIAQALERLISDPSYAVALGEAARREAAEIYSPEKYRERLCSYYQESFAASLANANRGGALA